MQIKNDTYTVFQSDIIFNFRPGHWIILVTSSM